MLHLQERDHYEDMYDRVTVSLCRRQRDFYTNYSAKGLKKIQKKAIMMVGGVWWEIAKIYITLERYDDREKTINEWMEDDRRRDELEATAQPPANIQCNTCSGQMYEETRSVWERNGEDAVLFFMQCANKHLPMQTVFSDGSEYVRDIPKCPDCHNELVISRLPSNEDMVKTKYSCLSCTYVDVVEFSVAPKQVYEDPEYEKDKLLFCLSEDDVIEARDSVRRMEDMKKLVDEMEHERVHKVEYDAVKKIKKLTIPQVKQLIAEKLHDCGYQSVTFDQPEMSKFVAIQFNVEEMETDNARQSTSVLTKLLKQYLKETNWRLMSDGVYYRLGLMTGRVRAYETKEELFKLVTSKKK